VKGKRLKAKSLKLDVSVVGIHYRNKNGQKKKQEEKEDKV
jgi:hypothetical protein